MEVDLMLHCSHALDINHNPQPVRERNCHNMLSPAHYDNECRCGDQPAAWTAIRANDTVLVDDVAQPGSRHIGTIVNVTDDHVDVRFGKFGFSSRTYTTEDRFETLTLLRGGEPNHRFGPNTNPNRWWLSSTNPRSY